MSTQAFAVFNVFVPKGSGITADDLISGNVLMAGTTTGTAILRIFEYISLQKVKKVCVRGNHFIITTGDVFCCGHRYTDVNEYKEMVNSEFQSTKYRVIDINKIHNEQSTQDASNRALISWTPSIYHLDEHIRWWLVWTTENNVQQLYVNPDVAIEKQMKVLIIVDEKTMPSEPDSVVSAEADAKVGIPTVAPADTPADAPVDTSAVRSPTAPADIPANVLVAAPADAPVVSPAGFPTEAPPTTHQVDTSAAQRAKICPDMNPHAWCGRCQRWH